MKNKVRLDDFLVSHGYFETKSKAQGNILAGKVKINGEKIYKAGHQLSADKNFDVEIESMPFVSRGGFKLDKAVKTFGISLNNKICLDAGASTGGFTDCMLQNGAAKVYAVDVGYGQIAWKFRNNPQVEVIERTNIRTAKIQDIYGENDERACFCGMDLSFISLQKVLPNIKNLMQPNNIEIAALIKPQFEAGKELVPKSGVIKDRNIHREIIENVCDFSQSIGLFPQMLDFSPIQGPAGNIEFLVYLTDKPLYNCTEFHEVIKEVVEKAHGNFTKN